jgi:hypothetical protein
MMEAQFLFPVLFSNLVGLVLIWISLKWARAARIVFSAIFLLAAIVNILFGLLEPHAYVRGYGSLAVLEAYRDFIHGPFAENTTFFVLGIAMGQLLIAYLLLLKFKLIKIGIIGGIIFFLAIAPLGLGSAFPSTVLMAIAIGLLWRKSYTRTVFQGKYE